MTDERSTTAGALAALTAGVVWGIGVLFVRPATVSVPTFVFWRLLLAVPAMWCIAYATGGRARWSLVRPAALPSIPFVASMALGFAALRTTTVANATLIQVLQPVLIVLVAGRLFGERVRRVDLTLGAVAIGGACLVVVGRHGGEHGALGDTLAVVQLLLFTGYVLMAKRLRVDGIHSGTFIATVFTISLVIMTPWCIWASGGKLLHVPGVDWLRLLGMVVGPGMIGHGLFTWAQAHVDVTISSLISQISPVISTVVAWVVWDERLSLLQGAGATLTFAALTAVILGQRGRSEPIEDALEVLAS